MWLAFLSQLLILYVVNASIGDRSFLYRSCVENCIKQGCHPDFGHISWASVECARCRYKCMWETVNHFKQQNEAVPQFHGKWPFYAISLNFPEVFIQEPASVIFSLANLYGMIALWKNLRRAELKQGSTLWSMYSIVGMITWICSTAFHWIDIRLTELLDYFAAFALIVFAFYSSLHIVFPELMAKNGKPFNFIFRVLHTAHLEMTLTTDGI